MVKEKKETYKKYWFWIIIGILFILGIIGVTMEKTEQIETNQVKTNEVKSQSYITGYEWKLKDTKIGQATFNNGSTKNYKYIVLGVENQDNDLESGEYIIKTNDNSKASFMIYITNNYYENIEDISENYYEGMVQGFDKSEISVKLKKGQYLYLCQNYNGQGKVFVNKK